MGGLGEVLGGNELIDSELNIKFGMMPISSISGFWQRISDDLPLWVLLSNISSGYAYFRLSKEDPGVLVPSCLPRRRGRDRQQEVAHLTTEILHLSKVLHKKDKHSLKGLLTKVQLRKKLLKYLRRTDWDSYCFIMSKLGLRDNPGYKQH